MINIEERHAKELARMSSFSWDYMRKRTQDIGGVSHSLAIIAAMPESEDEYVFENRGKFILPPGAGKMTLEMARFAKCTWQDCLGLRGVVENKTIKLPQAMFCLNSLLTAAFPKNTETGIFKSHDCGDGDIDEPDFENKHYGYAFGGIGVIMMQETRLILDPLMTDSETIKKADGYHLCIID